jgi:hypothetical protein
MSISGGGGIDGSSSNITSTPTEILVECKQALCQLWFQTNCSLAKTASDVGLTLSPTTKAILQSKLDNIK